MTIRIFISYRRDDSEGETGRLHDHLCNEYFSAEDIFFDVEDVPVGVNFKQVVEHAITACWVMIVIIGKSCKLPLMSMATAV